MAKRHTLTPAQQQQGGLTTKARYGITHYQEMGRKGGKYLVEHNPEHFATIGHLGGTTTKERYGPEYYKRIGSLASTNHL